MQDSYIGIHYYRSKMVMDLPSRYIGSSTEKVLNPYCTLLHDFHAVKNHYFVTGNVTKCCMT